MPPTLVTSAQTANWFNQATSKTTAGFDALTGDLLVAFGGTEDADTISISTPTNSGAGLTWTAFTNSPANLTDYSWVGMWWAVVDTDRTGMTVTFTRSGANSTYGGAVAVIRDHNGVTAAAAKSNATSGAPSIAITTASDNSMVVCAAGDWNAADGTTRTWRTINSITPASGSGEIVYQRNSSFATYYMAAWSDAGAAGAKTAGLTAPTGQKWEGLAVEVLAAAGGGAAAPKQLATLGVG